MSNPRITLALVEDGPILVKGAVSVIYGMDLESGRSNDPAKAIALCRCGQSENKPFCDGAHSQEEKGLVPGEIE
jgi:CDGSH-type Zn-finger protein